ncbi:MAG: membrane protein insertion efficiency factor YidD [Oligosphaeraceae bacterium]|jgi:putative membrane protein insertion efficiency factor|nr:membrane protein insertion efficiency factor YidD [Oligosphaeraceae bacterium]
MGITQRILLALIGFYRQCISPFKPRCCRFEPSCSEYGRQAILQHGCLKGLCLLLWRVMRCQPFYHGPVYDPVPGTQVDIIENEPKKI